MTASLAPLIRQINPQSGPAVEALLKQMAQPMTPSVDSLINQLIPLRPATGGTLIAAAKAGVLEAVVVSSKPLLNSPTTPEGNKTDKQQFKITINADRQSLELTSNISLTAGTRIQLSIAQNNLATILSVVEPAATSAQHRSQIAGKPVTPALNQTALISPPPPRMLKPEALLESQKTGDTLTQVPLNNRVSIEQGLRQALPIQQPLQNLLPLLQQITEHPPRHWPKALTHNLKVLLQQFPSAGQLQQAQPLKQAINNSGTFFEARLFQQLAVTNTTSGGKTTNVVNANPAAAINYDIKGLIQRLLPQIDKAAASQTKSDQPALANTLTNTTSLLADTKPPATPNGEETKHRAHTYSPHALPDLLPLTQNQQTTNKSNSDKNLDVLLRQLGNQLIASLARSQMNQLESLGSRQHNSPDNQGPINSWSLEMPILQGNHIDNLAMRIDQHLVEDENQTETKSNKKLWTVMLDFDLHQLGKMHVQLKIIDGTVAATVWSQQENTHREVKKQIQSLKKNLEKVGVNVKQLACQLGLPPQTNQPIYKQLVDVRT